MIKLTQHFEEIINITLHFNKASEQIKEMIGYINNNNNEYNINYHFDFKDKGRGEVDILFNWEVSDE